ncbi:SRPBCC domain-containing protein [Streptomyces sp. NPDC042319]|uniref:SRPBCC family protein n=1 Tax=Streptomyces sp. NPDC042319 TaxID=3154332 RepID=UPI0033F0AD28
MDLSESGIVVDVRQKASEVWLAWVNPGRLAEWFGTADGPLDQPSDGLRIDFGDGDFFDVEVVNACAPHQLELRWSFLGIGEPDRISVQVESADDRTTRVAVSDSGLAGPDAADLREGWRDFLARLARYCESGQRTRYQWSPQIAFSFTPPVTPGRELLKRIVADVAAFASPLGHEITVCRSDGAELRLWVAHPEGRTDARLWVEPWHPERVRVAHIGWDEVKAPPARQIALRRDWLGLWLDTLTALGLVDDAAGRRDEPIATPLATPQLTKPVNVVDDSKEMP